MYSPYIRICAIFNSAITAEHCIISKQGGHSQGIQRKNYWKVWELQWAPTDYSQDVVLVGKASPKKCVSDYIFSQNKGGGEGFILFFAHHSIKT